MSVFAPHEKAPEFVVASISIEPHKFVSFLKANEQYKSDKGYFKFILKKSQKGGMYLVLDTWKPNQA